MIVKTRAEVRALVVRRARIVNHLNSNATSALNIDLDDSYRDMRDFVTEKRWGTYLSTTGALSLPTSPPSGENYVEIPVPAATRLVRRLEVKFNTKWLPVEEVPFGQLRMFNASTSWFNDTRAPFVWTLLDSGMQATVDADDGTAAAGVIALTPVPTAGSYQLWTLAEHADLSADSGAGGFYAYGNQAMLDFHVFHCALKCATSDNDSQGVMAGLGILLGRAEQALATGAPTATGPKTWRRSPNYRS